MKNCAVYTGAPKPSSRLRVRISELLPSKLGRVVVRLSRWMRAVRQKQFRMGSMGFFSRDRAWMTSPVRSVDLKR